MVLPKSKGDGNLSQTNNCSFVYNALSQSQNGAKYFISYLDTETLKLIALKMHFKYTIGISKAQSNNNIPPAPIGKITDGWALNYKLIINASAGRHLSLLFVSLFISEVLEDQVNFGVPLL